MAESSVNVKYALYKYSTENIGNDIQSIAVRRFLPRVDYLIDRDRIGDWHNPNPDEKVRLIANGWYMKSPFCWPPTDPTIHPLVISMYVEPNEVSGKKKNEVPTDLFLRRSSRGYLKKLGQSEQEIEPR